MATSISVSTVTSSKVTATFSASSTDVTNYSHCVLYIGVNRYDGSSWSNINQVEKTVARSVSYSCSGLNPGYSYQVYYSIMWWDSNGTQHIEEQDNELFITIPNAPTISITSIDTDSAKLTCSSSGGASYYMYSLDGGTAKSLSLGATATLSGLSSGTEYEVEAYAVACHLANNSIEEVSSTTSKTFTTDAVYYTVTATKSTGIDTVSLTGSGYDASNATAEEGSKLTWSATVKDNYIFDGWYDYITDEYVSGKLSYSQTVYEDTYLIARAIPEVLFSASYPQEIEITSLGSSSLIKKVVLYHGSTTIDTLSGSEIGSLMRFSGLYPNSTYTIKITYTYGTVTTHTVTTAKPTLTAEVNGNEVTVTISGGRAYQNSSWSNYPSAGTLSGGAYEATFSGLAYNTTYTFYCTYRVANGSSYTYSSVALETTATTDEAPKYTISLSKDDATVASFNKTPNSQFEYGEWVTLTATAPSDTYLYIYSTPIIYYGTSSSGEQASTTGTLEHYVVGDQNFYAKGSRKTRTYSATATAEYVTATSQKITITDLSSTSGLNSYYYITENTSSSPVTSLSSAKSFARSTGSITLTGLNSGEHTYYCYVYNSTYGYYYLIDSVTFISGMQVELWEWTATERAAFTGKGKFNVLTASRWIEFCERFNEVVDAKSYASSLKITVPDIISGDILTAEDFNHVTNQIAWLGHAYFGQEDFYEGRTIVSKGDLVLGQYFIDLETALNNLINAL